MRHLLLLAAVVACATAVTAPAATGPRKVFYEETLPTAASGRVALTVRAPAAFRIVLRTATPGRTRLFLTGATAPRGGALIDTRNFACSRKAGSSFCEGRFEALPRGTYTFRIRRDGPAAHVQLTVRG